MKIFKRKPKKLIQARFIYDTSRIGVHSNYSDWQTVSEKEFKCAVSDAKKDGWTDVKYPGLMDWLIDYESIIV